MVASYEISTPTSCVRMRGGSEAGSSSRFDVSWDPVDGEAMLENAMGIRTPTWPIGITQEYCRIYAQRPKPVVLQEPMLEPQVKSNVEYQSRMATQRRRQQVQQNQFNKN
ncbi:hypothetical protein Tco_0415883 [Tanacetum coccineum]